MSKKISFFFIFTIVILSLPKDSSAQMSTPSDGDWKAQYIKLTNTPEAQYMIRLGDIDNLNYGWPKNFSPFSGASTPIHDWPYNVPKTDTLGFDVAMVPSSSGTKDEPCGADGYSGNKIKLRDSLGASVFPFHIPFDIPKTDSIKAVTMLLFVDDFQAKIFCAQFQVTLNGQRAPFLERVINGLNQTGPIGKLITVPVPKEFLKLFHEKKLDLFIDDPTTGASDGFAIDFIKILINPTNLLTSTGSIVTGTMMDMKILKPLANATVELIGIGNVTTDATGKYIFKNVPPGYYVIEARSKSAPTKIFNVDVESGKTSRMDLNMNQN